MSHGPLAGIVWWDEWSRIVRERRWRFPAEARESKSNKGMLKSSVRLGLETWTDHTRGLSPRGLSSRSLFVAAAKAATTWNDKVVMRCVAHNTER